MRPIFFVAASGVVLAGVAIWHLTVILASHPKDANTGRTSSPIDTTQMMKDARSLPVQQIRRALTQTAPLRVERISATRSVPAQKILVGHSNE